LEFLRDHASFVEPSTSQTSGDVPASGVESIAAKNRISELSAEVTHLRELLGKAKAINDGMWDSVVQQIVNGQKEQAQDAKGDDELRRRKRSRGT